jgi:subtilisin family serine protease
LPSRLAAAALLVLLAGPARAHVTETIGSAALGPLSGVPAGGTLRVVSGQAVIRLSSGTAPASIDAALAALGATRGQDLGSGWHHVFLAPGQSVASALPALRALPGVAVADPSRVFTALRTPNDPSVNSQYALAQVSAFAAWEFEVGSSSRVTIAVIDVGIDGTHPDLTAKLANTVSQAFNGGRTVNNPPTPECNHATRVSGVAAASTDNGSQVAGMSWGAQLLSLKVMVPGSCTDINCGNGGCTAADPDVAAAINYAVSLQNTAAVGKVVINISLGGAGVCPAGVVQTAITNAVAAGVPVVVASGNDGGPVNNPGNCAGAIPVGATDSNNNVASFSSRGSQLANAGLVAPGVSLTTTDEGGGVTGGATGTSFSAPMVSGLAALILSARPAFTVAQVSAALRGGADAIGVSGLGVAGTGILGDTAGAGRMDAYRSMRLAIKGTLAGFDGEEKPIAFPNPFKPSQIGTVAFAIPPSLQGGQLSIKIYTLDGTFVRTVSGLSWDGKNTEGTPVASGTYVFLVTTSAGSGRGRLAVLR